jgi:hypothetical protein
VKGLAGAEMSGAALFSLAEVLTVAACPAFWVGAAVAAEVGAGPALPGFGAAYMKGVSTGCPGLGKGAALTIATGCPPEASRSAPKIAMANTALRRESVIHKRPPIAPKLGAATSPPLGVRVTLARSVLGTMLRRRPARPILPEPIAAEIQRLPIA